MTSSENPLATKRHKREALRDAQKGNGRRDKHFRHSGRQSSGEGGIRTLGELAPTPVFETGPIGHSGTSPVVVASDYRGANSRREDGFPPFTMIAFFICGIGVIGGRLVNA